MSHTYRKQAEATNKGADDILAALLGADQKTKYEITRMNTIPPPVFTMRYQNHEMQQLPNLNYGAKKWELGGKSQQLGEVL